MFACPYCEFENPIQNRFCQRCGKALRTVQAVLIPPSQRSGASSDASGSATVDEDSKVAVSGTDDADTTTSTVAPAVTVASLLTPEHYLRGNQRYRLRSPAIADQAFTSTLLVNLIDCEPATEAPITQLLAAQLDLDEAADPQALLPDAAGPYWQLQEHFYPMVPELQAAWEDEHSTVIVLEDRTTWTALRDLIETTPLEPLELVHWLYEIVSLWEALTHFEAEASLLDLDNLWVDDDQILCIQRLIHGGPRSLQDLGQFWQALLQKRPNPSVPALENLMADVGTGIIADAATIEGLLANIAENLQDVTGDGTARTEPANTSGATSTAVDLLDLDLDAVESAPLPLSDLLSTEELARFEETDDDLTAPAESSQDDLPTVALPMRVYRLDEAGRTHVGRQRSHNEDTFFAETQLQRLDGPSGNHLKVKGLYVLCDGMGGHSGGEVASSLAVETLRTYWTDHWQTELPDEATVKEAILQANQAIFDKNDVENRAGNARMGTTLVMVLIVDSQVVVAHVGDSRLYSLTRQGLSQITTDHEVGQREINRGVEPAIAYARPDAYQLTQALGPRGNNEVNPTITTLQLSQDTLFLLCSDGMSDNDVLESHVDSHIEPMLRSRADLEEGVTSLITLANEQNGHDNITVVAVRVKMRPNLDNA